MTRRDRPALFDEPDPVDQAAVVLFRVGELLSVRLNELVSEFGIMLVQFGLLCILYVRDLEDAGLPMSELRTRMFVRGPDVTRLVDRLLKSGLVERFRDDADRRVVRVRLTDAGMTIVERIHGPLVASNHDLFAPMSEKDVEQLTKLASEVLDRLTAFNEK